MSRAIGFAVTIILSVTLLSLSLLVPSAVSSRSQIIDITRNFMDICKINGKFDEEYYGYYVSQLESSGHMELINDIELVPGLGSTVNKRDEMYIKIDFDFKVNMPFGESKRYDAVPIVMSVNSQRYWK